MDGGGSFQPDQAGRRSCREGPEIVDVLTDDEESGHRVVSGGFGSAKGDTRAPVLSRRRDTKSAPTSRQPQAGHERPVWGGREPLAAVARGLGGPAEGGGPDDQTQRPLVIGGRTTLLRRDLDDRDGGQHQTHQDTSHGRPPHRISSRIAPFVTLFSPFTIQFAPGEYSPRTLSSIAFPTMSSCVVKNDQTDFNRASSELAFFQNLLKENVVSLPAVKVP